MFKEHFKNKIKNIKAQIGGILRTLSLDQNLLAPLKKRVYTDLIALTSFSHDLLQLKKFPQHHLKLPWVIERKIG